MCWTSYCKVLDIFELLSILTATFVKAMRWYFLLQVSFFLVHKEFFSFLLRPIRYMHVNFSTAMSWSIKYFNLVPQIFWSFGISSTFYHRFFWRLEILLLLTADFLVRRKIVLIFTTQKFQNLPTHLHGWTESTQKPTFSTTCHEHLPKN